MENQVKVNYIIVGQGLAGSALAVRLLMHGKSIVVFDKPDQNVSSVIAAGLFNPITGRNSAVKTWLADILFPHLQDFYPQVERLTRKRFFFPLSIYKPFASIEDQNEWMGRSEDLPYKQFVGDIHVNTPFGNLLRDPFGGMFLKQCGYLDTIMFILAVRELIRSKGEFVDGYFDANALELEENCVKYSQYRAEKIIFCQGVHTGDNKWFGDVPIRPLKGEILTIKSQWQKDVILNRGVYMVSGGGSGDFKVGSTYNFGDLTPGITEGARYELEEKLKELIRFPYEMTGQYSGFRPTTPNRRPVLGSHPASERLVIFNGLGTKGVSLAPYFSDVLFHWLENSRPLDKDINVTRFKLLY